MESKNDLVFNILLAIFFVTLLIMALGHGKEARAVPLVVLIPGLALTGYRIVINLREISKVRSGPEKEIMTVVDTLRGGRRFFAMILWVLALVVLIWVLGFNFGTPLFVFLFLVTHKEKRLFSFFMGCATWAVIYGVFGMAMKLALHPGTFFIFLMKHGIYLPL